MNESVKSECFNNVCSNIKESQISCFTTEPLVWSGRAGTVSCDAADTTEESLSVLDAIHFCPSPSAHSSRCTACSESENLQRQTATRQQVVETETSNTVRNVSDAACVVDSRSSLVIVGGRLDSGRWTPRK